MKVYMEFKINDRPVSLSCNLMVMIFSYKKINCNILVIFFDFDSLLLQELFLISGS